MIVVECAQGSPEWLSARAGIVTASCFCDVLAKGRAGEESAARRNLRSKLVVERLTGRTVPGFTSAAMSQGTAREPLARAAYESLTGAFVDEVGLLRHDTLEAGASPDGLLGDDGGLELKCPELSAHLDYLRLPAGNAPGKYLAQIQGCMWITGRAWWDFGSWNPDFPERLQLVIRRVMRDERYISGLELAVSLFMDEVRKEESEVLALPLAA